MQQLNKILAVIFGMLSFLFLPMKAMADDAELYDPAPPPGSAYIRFINAYSGEIIPELSGKSFGKISYPQISDYKIFKANEYDVKAGKRSKKVSIKADGYYTIAVLQDGKIALYEDKPIKNPAKAMVYFYNLSTAAIASLYAPEHKTAVLSDVAADDAVAREVNALKLILQVRAGDKEVAQYDDVQLKRRRGMSFALIGKEGAYQAVMVENAIKR